MVKDISNFYKGGRSYFYMSAWRIINLCKKSHFNPNVFLKKKQSLAKFATQDYLLIYEKELLLRDKEQIFQGLLSCYLNIHLHPFVLSWLQK